MNYNSKTLNSLFLLVLVNSISSITCDCPAPGVIQPCTCYQSENRSSIACGGDKDIDLVQVFNRLTKNLTETNKHFKSFTLHNTAIHELKEYTFKDITFDEIYIQYSSNLTRIDKNALNGKTVNITYNIELLENTRLANPDNSLFEAVRPFVNLRYLNFHTQGFSEIPDNAFGNHPKLEWLTFYGWNIKKLGQKAFYNLNSLTKLSIIHTMIEKVPQNAFAFSQPSNKTLTLALSGNAFMHGTNFAETSLSGIQRPTEIGVGVTGGVNIQFTVLDEKAFGPFFRADPRNKIQMYLQRLDCRDCRNAWLTKVPNILSRLENLRCDKKKDVLQESNFKDCKSYLY